MVGRVVVVQHLDALELGEPVGKLIGLSGRDVGHHDVGRAVGRELLVHDVKAHAGLRGLGQVGGHIGLDLDPPHREHREDGSLCMKSICGFSWSFKASVLLCRDFFAVSSPGMGCAVVS